MFATSRYSPVSQQKNGSPLPERNQPAFDDLGVTQQLFARLQALRRTGRLNLTAPQPSCLTFLSGKRS
jgi:hypothetical protein